MISRFSFLYSGVAAAFVATASFPAAAADATSWYRGNTHTHTVICGHADSTPEFVASWYLERDYQFLILSEHNHFIDPAEVKLPTDRRKDFILIPGVEVTGHRYIHTTAMNVNEVPPWKFSDKDKSKIIQNHVDGTLDAGGQAIINHPNFRAALDPEDILPVKNIHLFELYNGHPHVHNDGGEEQHSTEALWDELLTAGMLMYGVSSDDAHHFQTIHHDKSNPGRGWVMVDAPELTSDAITEAMLQGRFYSSNGVFLTTVKRAPTVYEVRVDTERTFREWQANDKLHGDPVEGPVAEAYRIDFIGPDGALLYSKQSTHAVYEVDGTLPYVRAKVTRTVRHPDTGQLEAYYAWGQPLFTDGRADAAIR